MATVTKTFEVGRLQDLEGTESDGRVQINVRRHFGIQAFGTSAYRADSGKLISEHDETGFRIGQSHQEELYVVVAVRATGGKPGEAFFALPEEFSVAFEAYSNKDYERSIEIYRELLESGFPNRAGIVYNIACNEALLGRTDDAFEHLREAIGADPSAVELARTDSDLDPIRADPRFAELIG